jgi:carboxymethylenebutenolidase
MSPFTVNLTSSDGSQVPAYVALPQGASKGAVIVVQEIFGVNSHIRSLAEGYAAVGYFSVAPHAFHRVRANVDLSYTPEDVQEGARLKAEVEALPGSGVLLDLQAAVHYASGVGKVAIVGYCWGGLLAWRAAEQLTGLSAAICYYGGGMTVGADGQRVPRVPTLAHFGNSDPHTPVPGVAAFKKAHPEVEVYFYAAGHGFNCEKRGSYEPPAALVARERTLQHLAKHLG